MKLSPSTSIDTDAVIEFEGPRLRDNAWLTVHLGPGRPIASVNIIATDEGLTISIYPLDGEDGEPVASTYAFDGELTDDPS